MNLLDGLTDAVRAIGAVNTVVPSGGENTDYLRIVAVSGAALALA